MKKIKERILGPKITVLNNSIAGLMYYLKCVAALIGYDDHTSTENQNYDELTGKELLKVYKVAKKFHPSKLIKDGIFIVDQKLLFGSTNKFYEITDETIGVHVNKEIMIGGKGVKVVKLMACNDKWLSENYFQPIQQLDDLLMELKYKNKNDNNNNVQVISEEFNSSPVYIICPFCKNPIATKTESKLSFLACFCFFVFNILYCCVQICRDKNICCCDVSHRCPKCGRIVGHYTPL